VSVLLIIHQLNKESSLSRRRLGLPSLNERIGTDICAFGGFHSDLSLVGDLQD
jgi:hypothetical protein